MAVVGAGPAGLTTAIAARRAAIDVDVFERDPTVRSVGAGITIQANGRAVLRDLDVLDAFLPLATRITRASIETPDGRVVSSFEYEGHQDLWIAALPRQTLHTFLHEMALACGARVHLGRGCAFADEHGRVTFDDGTSERFDIVVGADGINSRVRESLGLKTKRRGVGYAALRLIADIPRQDATAREIWGSDRFALVVPLPDDKTYFACSVPPKGWQQTDRSKDWLPGWDSFPGDVRALIDSVPDWGAVRHDVIEEVAVAPWSRGRAMVIGDAAHAMAPNLGQGANCGMVDALALVGLVAGGVAPDDVGQAFETLRRPLVTRLQRISRLASRVARVSSGPGRAARNGAMRTVGRWGRMRERQMRLLAGDM